MNAVLFVRSAFRRIEGPSAEFNGECGVRGTPFDVIVRSLITESMSGASRLTNNGKRRFTMTDQRPKIAALVADAFQEEEYFFPKVALNEAGSSRGGVLA